MQRVLGLLFALLTLLGVAPGALAAASPHAGTILVAETTGAAPGSTVWVAVVQTLDRGWHTYWRNPGDAGEPMTAKWALPPGWRAGEIAWPAPKRLPVGPIMNYGYEGQVVLPVPIEVPLTARPGQTANITAALNFLVCAEVCIPESVEVSLAIPVVAGAPAPDPKWGPVIAEALAAVPKPSGLTAAFQSAGTKLTLAIAGAPLTGTRAADAYFYPYSESLIDHGKPQVVDRGPKGLTLTLAAVPAATPPTVAAGVLAVDGKTYEISAVAGPAPTGSGGLGVPAAPSGPGTGLLVALGGAFLGGLILNIMPCVFPILSMKAAALAAEGGDARAARLPAMAFLAGVVISFLGLALAMQAARAAGAAVGWGFQLQSPVAVAALDLVMLGAALNLSGLFEIGTSAQGLGAGLASRGGVVGSVFTGVLAVIVAAPCTAPFMGPALGFALTQPTPVALAVFLSLGLGFAAPFTVLSLSPALIRRLPRPGAWMDIFRKSLAFPMYGAAAWLAWVLTQQAGPAGLARVLTAGVVLGLAAWLFGLGQRRATVQGDRLALGLQATAALALAAAVALVIVGAYPAAPGSATSAAAAATPGELPSEPWSRERVAALQAAHRPAFVNFTAAWCVTCQVNDRVAFSSDEVRAAFKRAGAVYLVADWTNRDGAIAAALAEQGRIGVPLYLVYGVDGGPPKVLPQLLTPALVADALDTAAKHTS